MKSLASHTALLSLLLAGSAAAADMRAAPVKSPRPAVAPVATYNWTGCYIGAGGGYGMYNQDSTLLDGGVVDSPRVTYGGRGWFGTVQVGCDYQVAPSIVIGAFGDYDFSGMKGEFNIANEDQFGREKLKATWAVGGRLGWLPLQQQNFMVFLSGGYTQARFGAVSFLDDGGVATGISIDKHTYSGWFIGSGYEYVLGWFPGLTWKTEYRFADYGKENLRLLDGGVATTDSLDVHKYVHTVRTDLVWRFNFGGAPLVARY